MNDKSILSTKLTSENRKNVTLAGFLDKLEFSLRDTDLSREDIINELTANEIEFTEDCFRNRQNYIKAITPNSEIYFVYTYSSKKLFKAITKPSDFKSYDQFIKEFSDVFACEEIIENLPIIRVDKTIDIALSLFEVERGINIKFKRAMTMHSYESGGSTGFQVGKNNEVIKIYSRTKKAKLGYDCTRVEIMNKGNKVQFKTLKELKGFWVNHQRLLDHSFKNITLNTVEFTKINNTRSDQLYWLVSTFPYMLVRARLNDNGNFQRNFKKVHYLKPWGMQPTEIFNTGMRKFFNITEIKGEI